MFVNVNFAVCFAQNVASVTAKYILDVLLHAHKKDIFHSNKSNNVPSKMVYISTRFLAYFFVKEVRLF